MTTVRPKVWSTLWVLGLLVVGSVSAADPFTETLMGALQNNGFQVSEGAAKLYTLTDCIERTYPALKNCFLANPAAPYVVPVVKLWPDEYSDPVIAGSFVQTDPGYTAVYRLDPRDAIVMYGEMPPPGRYMGLQTWLFSQHGTWRPKDYAYWASIPDLPFPMQYLFDTYPPDDAKSHRILSVSAIGDVVNNVDMEWKSGYSFGEVRYFIITPSDSTSHAIRQALWAQGVPDEQIFTEQVPRRDEWGPIGPLGMGENAVDFLTAFRYAVPEPEYVADAATWRSAPPLKVLRVRAPASLGPVKRYGSLVFGELGATSELYLFGDMQNLVSAMCDRLGSYAFMSDDCSEPAPSTSYMADPGRDYGWVGPYCREIAMDCQGDQQEAAYYFASPRSLGDQQVFAVVGTLGTETQNATYAAVSLNDASMMAGLTNVLDSDLGGIKGLKGSADSYAGEVNNTDKFFVHFFAWNCAILDGVPGAQDSCSAIPADLLPPDEGDPDLRGVFILGLRDYIAVGTNRGPDSSQLLTPRIFTFTKQ